MRLLSETEILICLPIKGSRCDVKSLKEREAGYSRALAFASPGPHLSLQMLSAACLLATWESLEVVFASIALHPAKESSLPGGLCINC